MWKKPEAEFLDKIQTKGLIVFLLAIHSNLRTLQLCIDIYISSNSRNLLQILHLSYCTLLSRKEEYLIETIPLPYGLRNPHRNLKSEIMPSNLNWIVRSWIWLLNLAADGNGMS